MKVRLRHRRLAEEIARSRLSQNRWAQKLGLSKPHLSMLVNGKRAFPNARTRDKLLKGLGLPFEELFRIELPQDAPRADLGSVGEGGGGIVAWVGRRLRSSKGDGNMQILVQDLRYALRTFFKRPSFTAVAVITLALGIGANTAIFSIVSAFLLQPLPYLDPDRVAFVLGWDTKRDQMTFHISLADFADYSESQALQEAAAYRFLNVNLTGADRAERVQGYRITANTLSMLGVEPMLGRSFSPEDGRPGAVPVAILSHSLWQDRFGTDAGILGQVLTLNDQPHTVVGIMPARFEFPQGNFKGDLWIPLTYNPQQERSNRANSASVVMVARLREGLPQQRIQAELDAISQLLERDNPRLNAGNGVRVLAFREFLVQSIRPALLALMAAVGFVLLIACANVASLLLGRAITRRKEIAIRTALGAGRGRLIRQMATESALLSLVGGAMGMALAWQGVRLLRLAVPDFVVQVMPSLLDFSINAEALLFTLALSLLTGMLFGLAPALRASRADLHNSLKDGGRQSAASGQFRLRRTLAVAQIALSMVLLIGTGLMIRTFWNLQSQDPGFTPGRVLAFDVSLSQSNFTALEPRRVFFREVERRIAGIPGIEEVGAVNRLPFSTSNSGTSLEVEGRPQPASEQAFSSDFRVATPGYFKAMGIPFERGRAFTLQDDSGAPSVVIVNQALVRLLFPRENPLGQRIRVGQSQNAPWSVIVGVAGDVRHRDMRDQPRPEVYLPYAQYPTLQMTLVVNSNRMPEALVGDVRAEMQAFAPDQPIFNLEPLAAKLSRSLLALSFPMKLMAVFAGVALALAAIGLYGVISFLVGQRPREYGLRMALGARRSDILRMVMRQGLGLVAGGVTLGLVGAVAAARLLESLLFGITPADPVTFAVVSALLATVTLVACFIPARRATRVDPQSALRCE